MDKELSFDNIDVDEVVNDIMPISRVAKIIDENEFLNEDDEDIEIEEIEITLDSLGLD
ncbi:hypothetical protein [Nitrosomonas communis]|uniref:Uncharacterized protein n=1 Tax=Nitrosomonas communis TaxID=44574 RepID=A0A1I4P5Z3_9PROT|nr:hypothetical protein [Nitrosomonas communis]SFM22990.1 hypothetical protein SAMN05421863_101825 [Nitrosomonas communis]